MYFLIKKNNITNGAHLIGTLLEATRKVRRVGIYIHHVHVQNMTDDELKLPAAVVALTEFEFFKTSNVDVSSKRQK